MSEQTGFKDFGLDEKLLKAVEKVGYTTPTPIQIKAIPVVLDFRFFKICSNTKMPASLRRAIRYGLLF